MIYRKIITITIFIFAYFYSISQKEISFGKFNATVYSLEEEDIEAGYGDFIYQNEILGRFQWDKIDVPDRKISQPFPDVDFNTMFGIIFHSKIYVQKRGCYEVSISSDDGSIVWIDDEIVIDNGGVHRMQSTHSTIFLPKDSFDLKVWYFQAYATRYGIQFDIVKSKEDCITGDIIDEPEKISLSGNVLFDHDKHFIRLNAYYKLDSIVNIFKETQPRAVTIIGHTDSVGDELHNQQLSEKRAHSVLEYLKKKSMMTTVSFSSKGMGEKSPIASNQNPEGRKKNRRVEILFTSRRLYFEKN